MKIKFTRTYEVEIDDEVIQSLYQDIKNLGFNPKDEKEILTDDCVNYFETGGDIVEDNFHDIMAKIIDEMIK
jgi:hypothetical protein